MQGWTKCATHVRQIRDELLKVRDGDIEIFIFTKTIRPGFQCFSDLALSLCTRAVETLILTNKKLFIYLG